MAALGFSPLLIGGRARGHRGEKNVFRVIQFQSPSHRGPRARQNGMVFMGKDVTRFSPLLIGGRARGAAEFRAAQLRQRGFSPLLIGGRARGAVEAVPVMYDQCVSVPFS